MRPSSKKFKIGTRGSLLAVTQSTLIKEQLELIHGHEFELVKIKTTGDQIIDKPLWQLDGKDFFTKELDQALLEEKIDLVIHSYKDLGSQRPKGIHLGAITQRKFPHDILLLRKDIKNNLSKLSTLTIGTSSPRRIFHVQEHLKKLLPTKADIKAKNLRGNVNTRIQKLKDGEFDGIILALAGLERLFEGKTAQTILAGLDFMVLPLSRWPTAASQGALGIECLETSEEIIKLLTPLHHDQTAQEVEQERKAFQRYGGGCHLAVGITAKLVGNDMVLFESGEHENKKIYSNHYLRNSKAPSLPPSNNLFVGMPTSVQDGVLYDEYIGKKSRMPGDASGDVLFLTTKHCLPAFEKLVSTHKISAVSGPKSYLDVVNAGHFVSLSADSFGHDHLQLLLSSLAVRFLINQNENTPNVHILSKEGAQSDLGEIIPAYEHDYQEVSDQFKQSIDNCDYFFWTSFIQYSEYLKKFPSIRNKTHCCGLGKTLDSFISHSVDVYTFNNYQNFIETIGKKI